MTSPTSLALVTALTLASLAPTAAVAGPTTDDSPGATAAPAGATDDRAEAAAGWLADQLVDGERIEVTFDFGEGPQTFPDQGLTADVVFALAGAGLAAGHIEAATDWLEAQAGAYTGAGNEEVYAGSVAKLLLVAETTDRSTTFGGLDLVDLLESREQDSGRFTDDSESGDFSNAISQSLAVLALERTADTAPSTTAVDYLVDQACEDGGFPEQLEADDCSSQADATGYAVQALLATGETDVAGDAAAWLVAEQGDDGGFTGAEDSANANSTGLAAIALSLAGEDAAAEDAQQFLLGLQTRDCELGAGSIRYDAADGGDPVRATAQALPGLDGVGLAAASAAGASDTTPRFDCPSFPDVAESNVHAGAVSELARRGVIAGRTDGSFQPAADLTRGQLAAVVTRAAGLEPVDGGQFSDVDGHTHEDDIDALADAEVINGYPDGTFRPDLPVRRDQAAAILARWLELAPVDDDQFDDILGNTHRQQINALAEVDVARGTDDGRYLPDRSIRRDQAASLVLRALRVVEAPTDEVGSATAGR